MLQQRLRILAAVGVATLLIVAGAGWQSLSRLSKDLVESRQLSDGLVEQTDLDMLHDTLRGDAFAAASSEAAEPRDGARADVELHWRLLNQHLATLDRLPLTPALRDAYRRVGPDLLVYAGHVRAFVERSPTSSGAAAAELQGIAREFRALEPRLSAITAQFGREAAIRRDLDLETAAAARRLLLWVAVAGVGLFAFVAATVARRIMAQNAELEAARKAADEGSRVKSEFLSAMSHEIRTPMNGILGMVQVMSRHEMEPAQQQRLVVMRNSAETLLGILNNILDISKIEAGQLLIDNHEFDLEALVVSTAALFRSLAEQKDLALEVDVGEAAKGLYWGDGLRLRQVLSNLLSNAIKFTARGGVRVAVRYAAPVLEISVADDGIGIAAEQLTTVFERFTQSDSSTARRYGGTGLGLALSQEFAQLMGGRLSAESMDGVGSTFTLLLALERRAAPASPGPQPTAGRIDQRALRVLVAEDNPTNQMILTALLEPLDVEIVLAGDGAEAVEQFGRGAYHLVLMDIQMPNLDGVDASRRIRGLEGQRGGARTPIIALTANVMTHQLAEYQAAGMDAVVAKPIEAERLFEALERALAAGEAAAAANPA
jgi:signal transduction histidine kinase/CheY-like chemotaxis protein